MIELLGFLGNSLGKIFEITYYDLKYGGYDFDIFFERRRKTLRGSTNISLNSFFIENINYI